MDPALVVMYTDNIRDQVFTAMGYDQFGDEITPLTFTWSSTNESVGTVDSSGTFTGLSVGTTDVQAQSGTVTGTAEVVIKPHPDWHVDLIGAVNRTLDRPTIIDLSRDGPLPYTDPSGKTWEGASLSAVIGLVDDQDPATFNTSLADRDYTVTVVGKYAGNDKTVQISSRELIEGDKTFIAAYKLNEFEIPEAPVDGRTFWPLKLTGSGIANHGRNLEQITEISLEFPPDVREINITPDIVRTWESGDPIQFTGKAYDPSGVEIPFVPFKWMSSNASVGTVNETGYFTIHGTGTTEVWASFAGVEGSVKVYVYPDALPPHTWIVDQAGNGDFRTITEGVACARDGDTVLVRDGTYDELFKIEKGITLRSENGPSNTIITNDKSAFMIEVLVDNVTISGFTLKQTGFATYARKNAIRITEGDNCTISGNIFSETKYCIYVYKGHVSSLTIAGNRFNSPGTAISLETCDHAVVKDNIIDNVRINAIIVAGNGQSPGNIVENNTISCIFGKGTGIDSWYCSDVNISNNVIYDGATSGVAILDGQDIVVKDNVIGVCTEMNIYLGESIQNITLAGNELKGGKDGIFYLEKVKGEKSIDIYMNNISTHPENPDGIMYCYRCSPLTLNSTKPVDYIYNGVTYSNITGNYFSTYTGTDSDGDGLGDTPFTAGDTDHYHPLVSPIDAYLVLTPTTITITPAAATLEVGEGVHFTAEVFDQRGEAMPGTVPVWSSSNTTCGVVNATTGYFDALSPGNVTISASCEGCTESADITVVPATKKTETVSFEVPECTFTEDSSGTRFVSVNASNADIEDDRLTLQGDGFILTVMTTSMEESVDGRLNATYDALVLETDPLVADLPAPGLVSGSIRTNLTCLPASAGITTTLNQTVPEEAISAFQLAASDVGLEVDEVAFTMNIVKTNLTNGEEINGAVVRMEIDEAWVDAHGGTSAVRIIRLGEDGVKEVLETEYLGLDASEKMVFEGYSPNGFSLFGLVAISSPSVPGSQKSVSGSSSGGDRSDVASFAGSIPEGEEQTFSIDKTAIDRITVEAWDELSGFLVTVEKASLPKGIEMPASPAYEIQKTTLHHTDPAAIAGLVLEFSVPKTWLDAHDLSAKQITLMQYANDRWRSLPTSILNEDNEKVYYSAEADRFSYFAIVSVEVTAAEASVPAEETPVPTTAEVAQTTETSTPTPTTTAPRQTPVMWGLALIAVGAAAVMRRK
ncbi:MAG: PGF-pre-PGF domain-containing protein [Methanofollis sp.]|nr:PGF-pre-PGF domain-containing protein [Methanofollis sp.]